jgi:hypothetical protein
MQRAIILVGALFVAVVTSVGAGASPATVAARGSSSSPML